MNARYAGDSSPVRLYRDKSRGCCLGVCAGLSDYFGLSVTAVRVATVVAACLFTLPVVIGYSILGCVLKDRPRDLYDEPRAEVFWREVRTNPAETSRDLRQRFRELERRLRAAEAHVTSAQYRLKREIDKL
ncbi:MAG: envelope stress response membrane protein PspC [Sphingomonadales bacterium]